MNYFNTTNLQGEPLQAATTIATKQDEVVLNFFKANPLCEYTPCFVWTYLRANGKINHNVPVTSLRRSITNLTDAGMLEMTGNKVEGIYGRVAHTWKLKSSLPQSQLSPTW
jgi:hypothetical protein